MEKYKVKVSHLFSELVDVEAEDQEQAKQKALEIMKDAERKSEAVYETTISPEYWPVITEEQYETMVKNIEEELSKEAEQSTPIEVPGVEE